MSLSNVIHVGAAGSLGVHILDALRAAKDVNVSVLSRPDSKSVYPEDVRVLKVDFSNHGALVDAFRGKDAVVVSTGNFYDVDTFTIPLVDAAIEAGVERFIPAGWGFDLHSGPGSWEELLIPKYRVRNYLNKKAEEGKITFTTVACGLFYDWAIAVGAFSLDFEKKRAGVFDDGTQKIMLTTLSSVADSVVGILARPAETKNKLVKIHDFYASNLDVVRAVEGLVGTQFEVYHNSTEEQIALAKTMPLNGDRLGLYALSLFWGKAGAGSWELPDDSELVGLKKKDFREETLKALKLQATA